MMRRVALWGAILLVAAGGRPLTAQEPRPGPLPIPEKKEVHRIPIEPNAQPPSIPVEEIIRRFTEKEDEAKRAFDNYTYRLTVRVQEFEEDGSASGELQVTSDMRLPEAGRRSGKIVREPPSTLRRAAFSMEDLQEMASIPLFVLTTDQLSHYEVKYEGRQPIDELTTYIFRVKPKRVERGHQYFEGVVWVDDRDLVIVKTYGKIVTGNPTEREPPFPMVETYRQPADEKHWFPAYMRSDDTLKLQKGEVPIRLTIRYTDFKLSATATQKSAEPAKPESPKLPQN